jgi:hypothetical protein
MTYKARLGIWPETAALRKPAEDWVTQTHRLVARRKYEG